MEWDGSTIPGRGFCAFLMVYWTHMKLRGLSPHTIIARLDLTIAANKRKRLTDFLNECNFILGSPVFLEPENHDDLIRTRLQYTANRLLTLLSASMMDEEGKAH
jgi:hypothetical protein